MGIIYDVPGGGSVVGHVESSGMIFRGGAAGGSAVGHVESSGIIFNAGGGGSAIGHIESSGIIFRGSAGGGTAVGHIESSGIIFKGGPGGGTAIGHVDGDILIDGAGAALLLGLLDASSSESNSTSSGSSSSSNKKQSGGLAIVGVILKFLFVSPIGNIVLGLLIGIGSPLMMTGGHNLGFYLREGGWGPIGLGIIITAVGVFRSIRRYRK